MLHSVEVETEKYKVDMLNDKLVVRNEITMTYLFPALRARPVVKTEEYETIEYNTLEYETVVCDEMPMFPVKIVSLLQPSNPDLVMNELPAVAVEDLLSALVDILRIALECLLVRPDFMISSNKNRECLKKFSQLRFLLESYLKRE